MVGWVGKGKLPLSQLPVLCVDVLLALNILLAAVDHTNVACGERGSGSRQCQASLGTQTPTQASHGAGQHAGVDMDPALQGTPR